MFKATAKIIKACAYAMLILAGVTFSVRNHGKLDLDFFPLPYVLSMPVFLFALLVFALGLAMGWLIARLGAGQYRRAHKQATKRVAALENELGAIRTERSVPNAVTALPQK